MSVTKIKLNKEKQGHEFKVGDVFKSQVLGGYRMIIQVSGSSVYSTLDFSDSLTCFNAKSIDELMKNYKDAEFVTRLEIE